MSKALVPLLALFLAAGCIGAQPEPVERASKPAPVPAHEPLDAPPALAGPNLTAFDGGIAGVGSRDAGYLALSGTHVFEFPVSNETTALVIEVAWDAGDKLDVQVGVPFVYCEATDPIGVLVDCDAPEPDADGDSPARIVVTDAAMLQQVGEWSVGVWARASLSEVPFRVYVSQFTDTTPDEAYTAVAIGG